MRSLRSLARVLAAAALAALLALVLPAAILAQETSSRATESADDLWKVVLITLLAVAAVILLATLGTLYQRERGLHWRFQDPDPDDGHE